MKDNKTSTKHRVNLYIVMKYILERANLKKEEIESILKSVCSIKCEKDPEKLKGVINIYSLFKDKELKSLTTKENIEKIDKALKKVKVKDIKISEAMFENAKKEINKHYDRYIKDVGGSYKEWKEAFEKGDKEIIALIKKDNNGMIKNIQEKIKKENLTGKDLDLAKEHIESIKEENKNLDEKGKLDEKHKMELKANFDVQGNDVNAFETVKKAVDKLSYSDVKDLNKSLILDESLKEYEQTISI